MLNDAGRCAEPVPDSSCGTGGTCLVFLTSTVQQGNLGGLWEFLVFLSGLVPLLFVITGTIMWLKKRKRHIPMSTMTDDVTEEMSA